MHQNRTTGPPRPDPRTPEQRGEQRAFFDALYAKLEEPSAPRKRTVKQDRAYRDRANTKRRLRDLGERLERLALALETIHIEGVSPWATTRLPLCDQEWDAKGARAPSVPERVDRARKEAADGCEMSAAWLDEWEPLYLLCAELRKEAPPVRTPGEERERSRAMVEELLRRAKDWKARRAAAGWDEDL